MEDSETRSINHAETNIVQKQPLRLRDFIGQKESVALLERQLQGAQARGEPVPHIAFFGPSGVGKTLLAQTLADECGTRLIKAPGYILAPELARVFSDTGANDIVFFDEAHNCKPAVQEILYRVIDEHKVPLWVTDGSKDEERSPEEVEIQPVTIILATDEPGALRNALLKRIPLTIALRFYSDEELQQIVAQMATDLDLLISPVAAKLIARAAHGLPRIVAHHLQSLRYFYSWSEKREIKSPDVRRFLSDSGIDRLGLREVEHRYLRHLLSANSASLESLALDLGMDGNYVRKQIESVLVRQKLIYISSKGRQLTPKGKTWLENNGTNRKEGR